MGDMADDIIERDEMMHLQMSMYAAGIGEKPKARIGTALHQAVEDFQGSVWDMSVAEQKRRRAARLEQQAAYLREQAEAEETLYDRFGDQPELGTVLRFEKTWETNEAPFRSVRNMEVPVIYMYSAIRTKIGWTISARERTEVMTWPELVRFIGTSPCEMARKWTRIQ